MQRNQKEEWHKHIRREYYKNEELTKEARINKIIVPLETPVFAGWDVYLDLDYSTKRTHDNRLRIIMDVLGWTKPVFTKKVSMVKWIRKYHYAYADCIMYSTKAYNGDPIFPLDNFRMTLTEREFRNLPMNCKKYFRQITKRPKYGGTPYNEYHLVNGKYNFPLDDLIFRVKKSYWKSLIYLDGDTIGEKQKLNDKLWYGTYSQDLNKALSDSRYGYWREYSRAGRTALCKELARIDYSVYPQAPLDPELISTFKQNSFDLPVYTDALALEEHAFKKHKVYKKRETDW